MKNKKDKNLLEMMCGGEKLSFFQEIKLIVTLSIPTILAQISSILMQYIDASMVGRLGEENSAAVGLVSSTTWLFGGLCMAAGTGFTVQIAKLTGAKQHRKARNIVKLALICVLLFSLLLLLTGAALSSQLPEMLGGDKSIRKKASVYFLIFTLSLPILALNYVSAGMLQCSGNMKMPGILEIVMCFLDVIFNYILIFTSSSVELFSFKFIIYGAGLGIFGAALGTALAELITTVLLLYFLLVKSDLLKIRKEEKFVFYRKDLITAFKIALPVGIEQIITCGAYIAFTAIVSPLGTTAIAANSFSITAESLCYMPGYGIGAAATTIIGQCIGSKRYDLTKQLGWLTALFGIAVMTLSGFAMYIFSPQMIAILTADANIRTLGVQILRIEAFAEPMYGASIVSSGIFRGAGDTAVPSILTFVSMWLVRIPLAFVLSKNYGLQGVWLAMCIELCVRGALFLVFLSTRFAKRAQSGKYVIN